MHLSEAAYLPVPDLPPLANQAFQKTSCLCLFGVLWVADFWLGRATPALERTTPGEVFFVRCHTAGYGVDAS